MEGKIYPFDRIEESGVFLVLSLNQKVTLGFLLLAAILLALVGYSVAVFRTLESRMEAVNILYIPAIKTVNQVENSFFLLESDLDKSLNEGILRPKDNLENVIRTRLDTLTKLSKGEQILDSDVSQRISDLVQSYEATILILNKVYAEWDSRGAIEANLSEHRANFRYRLKSLALDLDASMREVSSSVQNEINRLVILLTVGLFGSLVAFLGIIYWLSRSLMPLKSLEQIMRSISQNGLDERILGKFLILRSTDDEIGTLTKETQKMAVSLLEKGKAIQEQKLNLERAHKELAQQNEELKLTQAKLIHSEKLGVVGKMAAQMAHEIRNPLNALNLHAELLEEQLKSGDSNPDSMESMKREINRLIQVTDSYLDLARGPKIEKEFVQLNDIIEELHDLYQPLLKDRGIYFTCDLGDLPKISIDRAQFSQVLGNLVKNATEAFSIEKVVAKYIRIISQFNPESQTISVTVMDNGSGISVEQQKNIFSPFYTNKAEGTGLGLTFSRQVVEAHGGEISFESTENQGTKFTIKIPAKSVSREEGSWKATELRY